MLRKVELNRKEWEKCEACRFCLPGGGGNFECHRASPVTILREGYSNTYDGVFPIISLDNWCGEWEDIC